ncbi:MAG TPA: c-type cytochrome domain-containing protein [Myxococcota bacterium]
MSHIYMPPALAVVGRTHLLLLHFPVAILFAVLLLEVALRKRALEPRREFMGALLLVAAVGAVVVVVTGLLYAQSESFHGREAQMLTQHRNLGIATAVLALVTYIVHRRGGLRVAYLLMLVLACAAVTATGHRGGEIVHGEGYLTEVLNKKSDKKDDDTDKVVASDGVDPEHENRERFPEGKVPDKPDYNKDIKPLIERSCTKCHGPEKRKSGLRLDKKRYAMKGGETGPAIVPGDVEKSLLTKYIQLGVDDDDIMPSKGKLLAQSEIDTFKKWIANGAEWPDDGE